jgi:hypothetical protein
MCSGTKIIEKHARERGKVRSKFDLLSLFNIISNYPY